MSDQRRAQPPLGARDSGLTLIELVVAMALFAMIAVAGLQAMTGSLRLTDRLQRIDKNSAELSLALSLLRADLSAMTPVVFQSPSGPQSSLNLASGGRVLSFTISGQPRLGTEPHAGLQRMEWVYDASKQTLNRRVWLTLVPADASAVSAERILLTGVTGFEVRSFVTQTGWQTGVPAPSASRQSASADEDGAVRASPYASQLPVAIEVSVQTTGHGVIVLRESL